MTIAQRVALAEKSLDISTKAREFINLARAVALSRGNVGTFKSVVHANRVLLGPRVQSIAESGHKVYEFPPDLAARQKAAIAAGTTTDSGWALPLADYNTLANAFLESLRSFGAFDAMLSSMRRVPFRTRVGAVSTGLGLVSATNQGDVKNIGKLVLSGTQIDEMKAVAILVLTDELARFSGSVAGNLFAVELSNAVAVETDLRFLSELISGATSNASNGVTAEHFWVDLRGMLAAITTNARSSLFLLMPGAIAKTIAAMHSTTGAQAFPSMGVGGGTLAGINVLVSDGVPASTMVLVDAQQIAAASETIQLAASNEAIVQMDSAPDSPVTASTPMLSLWQNNMTGLKAERFFGVEKLTTTGVAVVTGVAYVGDSPGP